MIPDLKLAIHNADLKVHPGEHACEDSIRVYKLSMSVARKCDKHSMIGGQVCMGKWLGGKRPTN